MPTPQPLLEPIPAWRSPLQVAQAIGFVSLACVVFPEAAQRLGLVSQKAISDAVTLGFGSVTLVAGAVGIVIRHWSNIQPLFIFRKPAVVPLIATAALIAVAPALVGGQDLAVTPPKDAPP